MTEQRRIAFSPPDITQAELDEVADALRSGWITTGPKTKEFEREIARFTQADRAAMLASATAALECALRALGIGPGDEVITSAYTYTASCSPICHVGATPVLCDTAPGSYEMDYDDLAGLVTERTRAVIPVDIAGRMCDYDRLFAALDAARDRWTPATELQRAFDRVVVVADAAHSLGATYQGQPSGSVADFTRVLVPRGEEPDHRRRRCARLARGALRLRRVVPPVHAAVAARPDEGRARQERSAGAWEYDIAFPGWKCNMTDIQAAIGLAQLRRYPACSPVGARSSSATRRGLADRDVDAAASTSCDEHRRRAGTSCSCA